MTKKSLSRRVLVSFALALTASAAFAPASQAWNLSERHHEYVLSPGQTSATLWDYSQQQLTGNIAVYEGAGTVGVCQRTWDEFSHVWREGCANNAVGNALNLTPYYGHWLEPKVKNNSANTHTIDDYYYFGTP